MEKLVSNKVRVKATLVDYALGFLLPTLGIQLAYSLLSGELIEMQSPAFEPILNTTVFLCYWILLPYWCNGQTLGKKIYSIKIIDELNQHLKISQLIKRLVFAYRTIFVWLTFQGHGRDDEGRLPHDRRSNTRVVFTEKIQPTETDIEAQKSAP